MNPVAQERWFMQRIAQRARHDPMEAVARVWSGATTPAIRKERLRQMILDWRVADQVIGRHGGQVETIRDHFERIYREPLTVPRGSSNTNQDLFEVTA